MNPNCPSNANLNTIKSLSEQCTLM